MNEPAATYKKPPYFEGLAPQGWRPDDITAMRLLCSLGDSITIVTAQ